MTANHNELAKKWISKWISNAGPFVLLSSVINASEGASLNLIHSLHTLPSYTQLESSEL